MFSDSKDAKVAHFGIWADDARDLAFRKEALRICTAAVERCIEEDLRRCPKTQAALNWLGRNGYSSAAAHFRRAFAVPAPLEREMAVSLALSYLTRQVSQQGSSNS